MVKELTEHWTPEQLANFNRGGECKPLLKDESESVFQANVNNLLRNQGWMVYHTQDSRKCEPGFPDTVALRGNRQLIVELKTKRRNLTPEQYFWLLAFCAAGAEVYVWYAERQEDWQEIYRVTALEEG